MRLTLLQCRCCLDVLSTLYATVANSDSNGTVVLSHWSVDVASLFVALLLLCHAVGPVSQLWQQPLFLM